MGFNFSGKDRKGSDQHLGPFHSVSVTSENKLMYIEKHHNLRKNCFVAGFAQKDIPPGELVICFKEVMHKSYMKSFEFVCSFVLFVSFIVLSL